MNLIKKFVRYSQFSTGDFEKVFSDFKIPPCPQVVLTLMDMLKIPDIDIEQIVSVLESDASLASQILKVVNSALYALPTQVTSISKAVSILGLKEIENLAIGYAMVNTAPNPQWEGFDSARYWSDSILRALFSRNAAEFLSIESEEAFSTGLLQDIAVPQLLSQWFELYSMVYTKWQKEGGDIHHMEKEAFSWNHCEAGAWIAKKWGLPDLFVCGIGLHGAKQADLQQLDLAGTVVAPVALSSRLTQTGFTEEDATHLVTEAKEMGIGPKDLIELIEKSEMLVDELAGALGVKTISGNSLSESLASIEP